MNSSADSFHGAAGGLPAPATASSASRFELVVPAGTQRALVRGWLGLGLLALVGSGVFSVLLPVSAAAIGVGVLGEPFTTVHALAFGLALAGLLLATWPARSTPAVTVPG